jgi:hypothetical protein
MSVTITHSFVLSRAAIFRELDGEAVILDISSGTYFGLNAVGTRIWQLLEQRPQLQAVLDALFDEFDAPRDVLEQDLLNLVTQLAEGRLGAVTE